MAVEARPTGVAIDGKEIQLFDITGPTGMRMELFNYGGVIKRLEVRDRDGNLVDVVLGLDTIEDYFKRSPYFGALIGRYANRIDKGSFEIDGVTYELAKNKDTYIIHGGDDNFSKKVFDAEITGDYSVRLTYVSPDGEEGFPGTLTLVADYELTDENALRLTYTMQTDKDTAVSITNHSYFNLDGAGSGQVLDTEVRINADTFTPADSRGIPTGEIWPVAGTPMDFTSTHTIGSRLGDKYEQLNQFNGYDHNYLLNDDAWCASAYSPKTGIRMDVTTTMPAVQFYIACNMGDMEDCKDGKTYGRYGALCFETQIGPDAPHHPNFPSTGILRAGEQVSEQTVYRFSVEG